MRCVVDDVELGVVEQIGDVPGHYHGPPEGTETYQLVIDDEAFAFEVKDGRARVRRGENAHPAVVVRADAATFLAVVSGAATTSEAHHRDMVDLDGDATASRRLIRDAGLTFGS